MKAKLFYLSLLLLISYSSYSCDVCGVATIGSSDALLFHSRFNYVGLQYNYARFTPSQQHTDGGYDDFHAAELVVRYHFTDRFKCMLYQPYKYNVRKNKEGTNAAHGLSDTRIIGSYTALKNVNIAKMSTLTLETGAGIKIPTGKYDAGIHESNLPENFNIGNGSFGAMLLPAAVVMRKNWGWTLSGSAVLNFRSRSGYQFGHQVGTQFLTFWEKETKKEWKVVPNAGFSSEWITKDHYKNGNVVEGTGGKGLYFLAGINLKKGTWMLSTSFYFPGLQDYSDGEVDAKGRLNCQVSYLF